VSSKKEEVESALKDVKHVSKGKKGKRAKSCVSNWMEKVLFQVIEVNYRFLKKIKKKSKRVSVFFPG
jgi:hypothetical protein